ncbi:hypothetical protein [Dyella flagellata]|uniref:4-oxalocrotonate tautomerase n=1 Tax=Dyella flagellata TaxID=1867833 RepID=A0ABQ5X9X5_9GAMM|nr:hypothetical protein [Dyella flagellata]GLQ87388.1 hypothetical protein GCM10007898_09540 [Dyella flagellata]
MPLTLTLTEGVLPKGTEKTTFARLSDCMLKWHGQSENQDLKRNVVGSIHVVPQDRSFSGSMEGPVVFIEWKVPAFIFARREIQQGYIEEATSIVYEASNGRQPKDRIWVNVVHAVDGAWGIAGQALTNAQLTGSAAA